MTANFRLWAALVLVVVCGFALRTHKALQIENYPHDDQISYLAASGKLDDYMRFMPAAGQLRTAPAAEWQAFTHADAGQGAVQAVREISQSLQQQDIHPPLYFVWLRGVVSVLPELSPVTGWFSNTPFYLATAFLLFLVARRLLRNPLTAVLATGIWCCGVAAIETSIVARHYEILTFFTLASTLYLLWLLDTGKAGPLVLLGYGVIATLGFLANYQFLYHLGALSLVILLAEYRRPARVLLFAAVTLLALGVALALYPALLQQSTEVAGWSPAITWPDLQFRIKNTLEEVLKFCAIGSLLLVFVLAKRRDALQQPDWRLWTLLGINLLGVAGVYLAFIAPRHAMGDRYLAAFWPFLSMALAVALFTVWQSRWWRVVVILLILAPALAYLKKPFKHPAPPDAIQAAPVVIADFADRGVWPSIFLHLKPEQATVAGSQSALLAHPAWIDTLAAAGGGMYCSAAGLNGNSPAQQQQVLDLLNEKFTVEPVRSKNRGIRFFRLRSKMPAMNARVEKGRNPTSRIGA